MRRPKPANPQHPARQRLEGFISHTKPDYEWEWYHRLWCQTLDRFVAGEIPRLMVFAPPRHGKSEIVSRRLPAYILGRFPDEPVMACSYSSGLASRMNRDVQRVMDDSAYAEVFPESRLAGKGSEGRWTRTTDLFEIVGRKGSYRSAGVGGSIVGMGFKWGIIDDPIKSQEQALSQVMREKVWEWYTSDFLTRQAKDARILLTVTRWHVDDLAGRLLRLQKEDPRADQWEVLCFPAIAREPLDSRDIRKPGEALWPTRYGDAFLAQMRATLGTYQFSSLYDQNPIPAEGGLFKASWFRRFENLRGAWRLEDGTVWDHAQCWRFSVLDPATGKNHLSDYTALGTFAVTPAKDLLLIDVDRERIRLEDLPGRVKAHVERNQSGHVLCEANGFQVTVVKELRKVLSVAVKEVLPQGKSKLVRAMPAVVQAESGKVHLPAVNEPWVAPYLDELCNWTGQDGDIDDQVDMTSYGVSEVEGRNVGISGVESPPAPKHHEARLGRRRNS